MKTQMITLLALTLSSASFADGFKCSAVDETLNVKVFNHTDANVGTRTAAVMVLSDSSIQDGRKTIASFNDAKNTLSSQSAVYTAKVDLRVSESNRKGELIAGTKLGQLDEIVLSVDHSYAQPVAEGTEVDGLLQLVKRNGEVINLEMTCTRYLKN